MVLLTTEYDNQNNEISRILTLEQLVNQILMLNSNKKPSKYGLENYTLTKQINREVEDLKNVATVLHKEYQSKDQIESNTVSKLQQKYIEELVQRLAVAQASIKGATAIAGAKGQGTRYKQIDSIVNKFSDYNKNFYKNHFSEVDALLLGKIRNLKELPKIDTKITLYATKNGNQKNSGITLEQTRVTNIDSWANLKLSSLIRFVENRSVTLRTFATASVLGLLCIGVCNFFKSRREPTSENDITAHQNFCSCKMRTMPTIENNIDNQTNQHSKLN